MSDELAKLKSRDPEAVTALVRRLESKLFRYAVSMVRNPESAKDIVQETYLDVLNGLPKFRGHSSIDTWVWKVAHRRIAKHFQRFNRKEAKLMPLEALGPDMDGTCSDPNPYAQLAAAQLAEVVQDILTQLNPTDQEILVLRDIEGFKNTEVAELLELSLAAVKSRLHRARLTLRKLLLEKIETQEVIDA